MIEDFSCLFVCLNINNYEALRNLESFQQTMVSTNTKAEKGSDQNTTVLYEHVSSNDKNTMPKLYIKQDKN